MFEYLTYERFIELANSNRRIAVYKEIPGDRITPISAYLALENTYKDITLLESSPKDAHLGRFSYLSFDQAALIKSYGQNNTITYQAQNIFRVSDPFDLLREYQKKLFVKTDHPLSGFVGGMVGFISYDAIRLIEAIPDSNYEADDIPDIFFRFYNHNITFDHQTRKVVVSTVAEIKEDPQSAYQAAVETIDQIVDNLLHQSMDSEDNLLFCKPDLKNAKVQTSLDDDLYKAIVNTAKQYIVDGDVFQVVPSREFSIETSAKPFNIYRALRFCSR